MDNKKIISLAKIFFWVSFILGNICLFGYIISKNDVFALTGYFLLLIGTVINLMLVIGLITYGLANNAQLKICMKASAIICINIPFAILYYFIGMSLLNL
ncbi:hypothetical protein [Chryseobacterium chendengshani]|uniref:hypothetical protein n=1 Tax=Chryseobacterium sp. LJ756 TaxID=2864113 RepID=UPI001C63DC1C|nr:hypothetical protein [Chryseobacterium sp. LJ756]MBW7676931.1 hypothetical protein [Chryseobacterium sp. LJ756]